MSTKPKWTPGEWATEPCEVPGEFRVYVSDNGMPLAQRLSDVDAQLVAAAPDLYAALAAVEWGGMREWDYECSDACCPSCQGWTPADMDEARTDAVAADSVAQMLQNSHEGHAPDCQLNAALRKARGEG